MQVGGRAGGGFTMQKRKASWRDGSRDVGWVGELANMWTGGWIRGSASITRIERLKPSMSHNGSILQRVRPCLQLVDQSGRPSSCSFSNPSNYPSSCPSICSSSCV